MVYTSETSDDECYWRESPANSGKELVTRGIRSDVDIEVESLTRGIRSDAESANSGKELVTRGIRSDVDLEIEYSSSLAASAVMLSTV